MLTFILIDSIEKNNYCTLINFESDNNIQNIDSSSDVIQIKTVEEFKEYFNSNYNGIYDFLEDCHDYIRSMKIIINLYNTNHKYKKYDKVEFYIAKSSFTNNFGKFITTPYYKYAFSKKSGKFIRWGLYLGGEDIEVKYSPLGPEIADIEISTICHGPNNKPCSWCYKSNIAQGKYMTLDEYKKVLKVLNHNHTLTQVALGIGDIDSNPDLEKIIKYTRYEMGIIPNITINGFRMNDYYYDLLSKYCGAVSVSRYDDTVMTETIKNLYLYNRFKTENSTLQGINIHMILCNDTFESCMNFVKNIYTQNKLRSYVNAIIFLTMKPVGCRNNFKSNITEEQHKELIDYCLENDIPIGFDSCGCYNFLKSIQNHKNFEYFNMLAEPCESSLFSIYVNVDGYAYPCSFYEQTVTDKESYPYLLFDNTDLMMDVWFNEKFNSFRKTLLSTSINEFYCRRCPLFNI